MGGGVCGHREAATTLLQPSGVELTLQVSTLMFVPPRDYLLPWSKEIHFSQRLINLQISLLEEVMLARILMRFLERVWNNYYNRTMATRRSEGRKVTDGDRAAPPPPAQRPPTVDGTALGVQAGWPSL